MTVAQRSSWCLRSSALWLAVTVTLGPTPASQLRAQQPPNAFRPVRLLGPQTAITHAPVKSVRDAAGVLNPSELVIGVTVGGESRAYPINMLTGPSREIINDTLGDTAIAATW